MRKFFVLFYFTIALLCIVPFSFVFSEEPKVVPDAPAEKSESYSKNPSGVQVPQKVQPADSSPRGAKNNLEVRHNERSDVSQAKGSASQQNKYAAPVAVESTEKSEHNSVPRAEPKKRENTGSSKPPVFKVEKKVDGKAAANVDATKSKLVGAPESTGSDKKVEQKSDGVPIPAAEQNCKPDDLPEVEAGEVILPQVVAKRDERVPASLPLVAVAWLLILVGILGFIFIIVKSARRKSSADGFPMDNSDLGSKKGGSKKRLLPEKYYR